MSDAGMLDVHVCCCVIHFSKSGRIVINISWSNSLLEYLQVHQLAHRDMGGRSV